MNLAAILALGFLLGMRHATDADHVVAVSTIVGRERTLRAAAPIGLLWGLGHTLTILMVGGSIVLFGIVIPPRVGLGMELAVAIMLLLLGGMNLQSSLQHAPADAPVRTGHRRHTHSHGHSDDDSRDAERLRSMRPLVVGIVHGLAGSAAVALLVLGGIREPLWSLGYLLVFGVGTIAGMSLITMALAMPIAAAAQRFERLHQTLSIVTGLASIGFGAVLVYQIGFVHGLFTGHSSMDAPMKRVMLSTPQSSRDDASGFT